MKLKSKEFEDIYKIYQDFDVLEFDFHDKDAASRLKCGQDTLDQLKKYQRVLCVRHDCGCSNHIPFHRRAVTKTPPEGGWPILVLYEMPEGSSEPILKWTRIELR